jgi:hypothetical protein
MNSADVFRIDFLGLRTKLGKLRSNFPRLVAANHARFHGAEIVDLNCKLLARLAQEYTKVFCQHFEHTRTDIICLPQRL